MQRLLVLALACLTPSAWSQLDSQVAPAVVPFGGSLQVGVTNPGSAPEWIASCPWSIYDAGQQLVRTGNCIGTVLQVEPGQTRTLVPFDGYDDWGLPVMPGHYTLELDLGGGLLHTHSFQVQGSQPQLGALAAARLGSEVPLALATPGSAFQPYLVMASDSNAFGIVTCGGTIPVDPSPLWYAALTTPSVFRDFAGSLDWSGSSAAPTVVVPNQPALAGLRLELGYALLDPSGGCGIAATSAPASLTLVP